MAAALIAFVRVYALGHGSIPLRAMGMLADILPLDAAVFYAVDPNGEAVDHELFHLPHECVRDYRERFHRLDPCHPRRFAAGSEDLVRLSDLLAPTSFSRSEYYRDFFRRLGMRHEVEVFLRERGRIVAGMSLLRSASRGDFADCELDAVARLRPLLGLAIGAAPRAQSLESVLAADCALSRREIEVVRLVAKGARNDEIARALFVSLPTVKTHLQHVFEKMGVRSRTELAARVHAFG